MLIRTLIDHAIEDWRKERALSDEALDFLLGGGGPPSVTFPDIGSKIVGRVLKYEMAQQIDFATKKPAVWEDGNPKMQAVIHLQAEDFNPQDDDDTGKRRLFVKGAMRDAIKDAITTSGFKGNSLVGGKLGVVFTGFGESKNGLNPPKKYVAKFAPPSAVDMLDEAEGPAPEPEEYRSTPGVVPEVRTVPIPGIEAYSEEPF